MLQTQKAEYVMIQTERELDGQKYRCYGIKMIYAGAEVTVEDLSLQYREVEELVRLCNEKELSPLHFQDILEDFLVR